VLFFEGFNLVWPSVKLGLTRGVLVILAEKDTLSALVFERVIPRHSRCSHGPMEGE